MIVNDTQNIKHYHLFSQLSDSEFESLEKRISEINLSRGETLFHGGAAANYFYYLVEGQIKLSRISMDGTEKVVGVVKPNQSFAEATAFMDEKTYPVNAIALCDATVLSVPSKLYVQTIRNNPDCCMNLLGMLSSKLRGTLNRMEDLMLTNATHRVVRYLLSHISSTNGNHAQVDLDIPKQLIASNLAIKPETFSRILNSLSQQGAIRVARRTIHIEDLEKLRNFE